MLKISQESGAMLSPGKTKVLRAGRILGAQQSPENCHITHGWDGKCLSNTAFFMRTYTDKVERQNPDSHRGT